jgi:hypothetical protein
MSKLTICILLVVSLASPVPGQSQANKLGDAGKQPTSTSFVEKLLKFSGISDSSETLKGVWDEVVTGEVWIADLETKSTHSLTPNAGYRSPVFLAGTEFVVALQGNDVVKISTAGGESKKLYSAGAITKLLGCGSEDLGKILVLMRGEVDGRPRVGLLTVNTGTIKVVPYNPSSGQDLQMLESLQGWARTYGDQRVYVKRQTKQALSGTVEWSDVFLKVGDQQPVDISQCDRVNCGQPSLSENGRLLVFVKAHAD